MYEHKVYMLMQNGNDSPLGTDRLYTRFTCLNKSVVDLMPV